MPFRNALICIWQLLHFPQTLIFPFSIQWDHIVWALLPTGKSLSPERAELERWDLLCVCACFSRIKVLHWLVSNEVKQLMYLYVYMRTHIHIHTHTLAYLLDFVIYSKRVSLVPSGKNVLENKLEGLWFLFCIYKMLIIVLTFAITLRNFIFNLIFPLLVHAKWKFSKRLLGFLIDPSPPFL